MSLTAKTVTVFRHPYSDTEHHSRALLYRAASRYSGLAQSQLGPVDTNAWGKPFFPNQPHLHFSVTHSGSWWLCAFSDQPIGLDLQLHSSHTAPEKLSRRFFHPKEDAFLGKECYRSFFDLWCAKESWVKFTGRGFYDAPDSFCVVSDSGVFPYMPGVQLRLHNFAPDYSFCLCAKQLHSLQIRDL